MGARPGSVLFACTMNAVRSPMAEALFKHLHGKRIYAASVGLKSAPLDPFVVDERPEARLPIVQDVLALLEHDLRVHAGNVAADQPEVGLAPATDGERRLVEHQNPPAERIRDNEAGLRGFCHVK